MKNTSQIVFKKDADGKKTPWRLVLDNQRVLVSFEPLKTRDNADTGIAGVTGSYDESGNLEVHALDTDTQRILQTLVRGSGCWFAGCQDILDAYHKKIEALEESDAECPPCARGDISKWAINEMKAALERQNAAT
jgi:uncharacterized protein YegP (UPF0339 family)